MKRVKSLGLFLAAVALGGHTALRRSTPRTTAKKHTGPVTATDIDNLVRAADKRARKAAKLRRDHERATR
jgi:hypothetical protein